MYNSSGRALFNTPLAAVLVAALIVLCSALPCAAEGALPSWGLQNPRDAFIDDVGSYGGDMIAAEEPFSIDEMVISGNSVFSTANLVKKFPELGVRGGTFTAGQLEDLRAKLEEYYSSKGYILARVMLPEPEAIRKERKAEFTIVEGRIGKVYVVNKADLKPELKIKDMADLRDRLDGGFDTKFHHFKQAFIMKKCSSSIAPEKVYNVNDVTRTVILANELVGNDLEAQSFFIESKDREGYYDAIIVAKEKNTFHVGIDYNNFGNPYTGENRYGMDLTANHLTRNADTLFVRGVYSAPAQSSTPFVQAIYSFPLGNRGSRLSLSFANADVRVGKELAVLDIRGRAEIYSAAATFPLKRVRKSVGLQRPKEVNSNWSAGFTSKSVKNYFLNTIPSSDDQIRSLSIGYDTNWTSGEGKNFVYASVTQGLGNAFGGMKDNDPMASRFKASNSYTRINLDAFRIQRAGSSNKLFLIVRGSGQIATAPLVVAEQFNLGGPDSVRGYMQSEVLGDSGYSASAELRISMGKNIQGALFVDHGTAYLNKPLPSERAITSLTGAGVGARMKVGKEGSVRLDWGFPLTPKPNFLNRASMVYGQFSIRF